MTDVTCLSAARLTVSANGSPPADAGPRGSHRPVRCAYTKITKMRADDVMNTEHRV